MRGGALGEPAIRSRQAGDRWTAAAGIRLDALRALPGERGGECRDLELRLLDRQLDFLRGLRELPSQLALELRYLHVPEQASQVGVYLLARCEGESQSTARSLCTSLVTQVSRLLLLHHWMHAFELVEEDAELARMLEPFPFRESVEITRRDTRIDLDPAERARAGRLGFDLSHDGLISATDTDRPSEIHLVVPFSLTYETMERLCLALSRQEHPCLWSVFLRTYRLTSDDERALLERIRRCEKYAQLGMGENGDVHLLEPFLRSQATDLGKRCARELFELQDAAFRMRIQLVSSHSIPPELAAVAGASLTEPTGHPRPPLDGSLDQALSGGFHCRPPTKVAAEGTPLGEDQPPGSITAGADPSDQHRDHWISLVGVTQAAAAFRLPTPLPNEFPGIETMRHRSRPAPSDLPAEGLLLGENVHGGQHRPVFWAEPDRRRHGYVVGQTGTGKSTLFLGMILQDVQAGRGIGLIDPHGELIEQVLERIPANRAADVVYLDPKDRDRPFGMNMLEHRHELEKDFAINYLLEVFDLLYDLRETGGPMFELYMRNALQLLLDQPGDSVPTVLAVPRVFQDQPFRHSLLETCTNPFVRSFWRREAEKAAGEASLRNMAPYITSKLTRFVYNGTLRAILGQARSTVDFRAVMDQRKILLVDLRKGLLGVTNSQFIGMLTVGKIFAAAMSRTDAPDKASLPPFHLYVDEFQNLATSTFVSILSEARKYGLSLVLTNQYIAQLPDHIVHGIFGNVGTLIAFRVGASDAAVLDKELGGSVGLGDLTGISNWNAHVRLQIGGDIRGPFTMRTLPSNHQSEPELADTIRKLSRMKHGRPRESVDAEIETSWSATA